MGDSSRDKKTVYYCTTCMPKYEYEVSGKEWDFRQQCECCGRDSFCIGIHLKPSRDEKQWINEALNIIGGTKDIDFYKPKPNMEKQIKMSLETARELYKEVTDMSVPCREGMHEMEREPSKKEQILHKLLLENFTRDELEGNKGYTWEESFDKGAHNFWFIGLDAHIYDDGDCEQRVDDNKKYFKTKEQAKSALAFAMLSHIVSKTNEGKSSEVLMYVIRPTGKDGILMITTIEKDENYHGLAFYNPNDAGNSIGINSELWKQYWMINNG